MTTNWLDTFAALTTEAALDQLLRLDPASAARARALAGHRLALTLEPGPVTLTLAFTAAGIDVDTDGDEGADAAVTLDPSGLANVLAAGQEGAAGARGVTIRGDAEFAGEVLELLRALRPDLLAPLANVIGDAPAHVAGEAARRGCGTLRQTVDQGMERSRSWLTGPDGWLPGRVEMARFLDEVDALRLATDRLEARIRRLHQATRRSSP